MYNFQGTTVIAGAGKVFCLEYILYANHLMHIEASNPKTYLIIFQKATQKPFSFPYPLVNSTVRY